MPNGKAPSAGDVIRNHDMAGVLRELGTGGKEAFYGGRVGEAIVEVLREMGGVLTMEDLKARKENECTLCRSPQRVWLFVSFANKIF